MTTAAVASGPTPSIAVEESTMYIAYDAAAASPSSTPVV
jgi:hypothetical protein